MCALDISQQWSSTKTLSAPLPGESPALSHLLSQAAGLITAAHSCYVLTVHLFLQERLYLSVSLREDAMQLREAGSLRLKLLVTPQLSITGHLAMVPKELKSSPFLTLP